MYAPTIPSGIRATPIPLARDSATIWLTGLPGAGKTTLAMALATRLKARGCPCEVIDGDALRKGGSRDLGFSKDDRLRNVLRAAALCRGLNMEGIVAIAALVSPYQADREQARSMIGANVFREVWVATPLAVCEQRDPKGLYRRARAGEVRHFTGIDDPYEPPVSPDLALQTHDCSIDNCVGQLERLLAMESP